MLRASVPTMENLPKLYLSSSEEKETSPIATFLDRNGIGYVVVTERNEDELRSKLDLAEAESVDSQLPIFEWVDGELLQQCDVEKLVAFLHDNGVELEDS